MKAKVILFFLIISLILGCNVSKDVNYDCYVPLQAQEEFVVSYSVTPEDVDDMIRYRFSSCTKSDDKAVSYEVIPYGLPGTETLMYIVNYSSEEWEIISADKRTPVVLASGDGVFTVEATNAAAMSFLNMMGEYIMELKNSGNSSENEFLNNIMEWVEATGEAVKVKDACTKAVMNYYYLVGSEREIDYEYNTGKLLYTKWDQSDEHNVFNNYCPFVTDSNGVSTGVRAAAGCTIVAGAQVLHYLYKKYGANIYMPNSASCEGTVNDYTQTFSKSCNMYYIREIPLHKADTIIHNKEYTSIFLAWIGNKSNVEYANDGSGASFSDLTQAFDIYNIGYTHSEGFNADTAINSVLAELPVIVGGFRYTTKGTEPSKAGHSWVIDGYRQIRTDRTGYYYRSPRELTEAEVAALTMSDCNYTMSSVNYTKEFHMNWGWGGSWDGYYLIDADNWKVGDRLYNMDLEMMYNFTK